MANSKLNNIKLGLFVTIAFALFAIATYNIGNRQFIFGSGFEISTVFDNVKGLRVGSNVRYAGISVGSVDRLVILENSTIRVEMTIDHSVEGYIRKDAIANITTDGLVGNMIVNITAGDEGMIPIVDGDVIQSSSGVEADDVLNSLGSTTDNIAQLTTNLLELTDRINDGEGLVATLINDPNIAKDVQRAVRSLATTSQNMDDVSNQINETMDEMKSGEGLLGYLMTDTTFEHQIQTITVGLDTLVNHKVAAIIDDFQRSSDQITEVTEDLSLIIKDLDLNEGMAGVLLKDSIVAEDVRQMIININQGTERFNESMEALQHNFLLRGYFKKKEKRRKKELEKAMREQQRLEKATSE